MKNLKSLQNQHVYNPQAVSLWIKLAIILLIIHDLFGLWFILSFYFIWG